MNEYFKNGSCVFCGWCAGTLGSHIDYGVNNGCSYITANYDIYYSANGDFDFNIKKEPDCAFGYCCERLYNRGCLPKYELLWNCNECKYNTRKCAISECDHFALQKEIYCKNCITCNKKRTITIKN